MSVFDNKQFFENFPFSTSLLRDIQTQPAPAPSAKSPGAEDAQERRADIADPDRPAPAPLPRRDRIRGVRTPPPPQPPRLLPLETFVWGGAALPPQPRTRLDHALIWVTAGRINLDFPRHRLGLRAGDLRLIPPGTAFAALPLRDARGHVALIPSDLAATAGLPRDGMSGHVGTDGRSLLSLLSALAEAQAGSARAEALMRLLARRLHDLEPARTARPQPACRPLDRSLVTRFLTLAVARLGDPGSLADLAGELGTTIAALDRACLAARGRRAIELMHDLRLERAASMLRHGRQSPAEIASELGYSSHAHFTRAFVAATGRSPETFRAQPC